MSEYEEYSESLLYNRGDNELRKRIAQLERQLYRTTQKLEDTRREQERILNDTVLIPPQYIDDSAYIAPVSMKLQKQEIAPPATGATTGESEFDPDAPGAFIAQQYKESKDKWVAVYPGIGVFPSGVGLNTFDFVGGRVKLYNGASDSLSGNLSQFRAKYMEGVFFWSDQDADIRFFQNGRTTSAIYYDQSSDWADVDLEFDRMEVRFTYPGNFQLVAQTKHDQLVSILRHLPRMARYASGTTTNVFTPVQWQASSGLAGGRSATSQGMTSPILHVPAILTKTVIVFNLDQTNSLNVGFQGKSDFDSNNFAFDATTGASAVVAASTSKTLQTTTGYQFMQLLIQSATANKPVAYECQMTGTGT